MVETQSELTIQEVAEATGLTVHTLRYYERAGLLPPVARNAGGHRRYAGRDVDALRFLSRLRLTGMPIHEVRRYAELTWGGVETVAERKAMMLRHRDAVLAQRAALDRNLAAIDFKIALYEDDWTYTGDHDPRYAELRRILGETHDAT